MLLSNPDKPEPKFCHFAQEIVDKRLKLTLKSNFSIRHCTSLPCQKAQWVLQWKKNYADQTVEKRRNVSDHRRKKDFAGDKR